MKSIRSAALLSLLALVILAACSAETQPPPSQEGSLAISIEGLPAGVSANVNLSGPGGYNRAITASRTLGNLTPGSYTLAAAEVDAEGSSYLPDRQSQSVTVTAGATASATVFYSLPSSPARLDVNISGLSGDNLADVTLVGPNNYSHKLTASTTLEDLIPGNYTVIALSVAIEGAIHIPSPAKQGVGLAAGESASVSVAYSAPAGRLQVDVSGLPGGVDADIAVTGPEGYSQSVAGSTTLTGLAPGSYTITAGDVISEGATYTPSPGSQSITVSAGGTATASVAYTPHAGSLSITIAGLPEGLDADVTVAGPEGYSQSVTSSITLGGLAPGTYVISAQEVSGNGGSYQPQPGEQEATVASDATATATVTYELQDPAPLPNITEPQPNPLELSAEVGQSLQGSFSFGNDGDAELDYAAGKTADWLEITEGQEGSVAPGENATVVLQATCPDTAGALSAEVTIDSNDPDEPTKTVTVNLECAPERETGSLEVEITGLPEGVTADVTVMGPDDFSESVEASKTLANLTPGSYTVSAGNVSDGDQSYTPSPSSQSVTVSAGGTATASVAYAEDESASEQLDYAVRAH